MNGGRSRGWSIPAPSRSSSRSRWSRAARFGRWDLRRRWDLDGFDPGENAGQGHGHLVAGHCAVALEGPVREPFEDALRGQLGNRVEGPVVSGHIGERLGEGGGDQRKHEHCCDGECEMPHFYPPCCCLSRWPRGSSDGGIKFPPAYPMGTVGSVVPPSRSGGRSPHPPPP